MKARLVNWFQRYGVRPAWVPFYTHVYKLALRGMGVLNAEGEVVTGEVWLWQRMRQRPVKVVFDVGTNTGGYMAGMQPYFSKARYYGFEPNPETFSKLVARQWLMPPVLVNAAMGEKPGVGYLYDYAETAPLKASQPTSTMASLYKPVIERLHGQPAKRYQVKVETIDTFCAQKEISKIDWLNIDAEGHEYFVLLGAKKMLAKGLIDLIQFEFNEMHAYSKTFLRDFWELLPNYDFYRLLPNGWYRVKKYQPLTCEVFGFQNWVCLKRSERIS